MPPDSKKTPKTESFSEVTAAILGATGWRHGELARRFGISGKSLTRYQNGRPPPRARCRDMVRLIDGIDPALHVRLARSLDVDPAIVPAPSAPRPSVDPASMKDAVAMAIYAAADDLDLTPAKTRAVVRMFLGHMVELGIDAATARAALPVEGRRGGS